MRQKILYISYDGMLEPLGQSQVLGYLKRLAADSSIHLISFEKPDDLNNKIELERISKDISGSGIIWHPLRYHKSPSSLATLWDISCGIIVGLWLVLRFRLNIVHARSYVASVIAIVLKKLTNVGFIFDMRGFWADERVDGGMWSAGGWLYRFSKWCEKRFLLSSDYVIVLTHAAVNEMRTFSYLQRKMPLFEVITTCTDLELFHSEESYVVSRQSGSPFILGYVGSVTGWYLFDDTLRCFQLLRERKPDAQLLIINRGGHDFIRDRIHALNIDFDAVRIEEGNHEDVARAMQKMDAGIFFIKPVYSKMASAPTKLGEFLGCGVPCLGNSGVGDMGSILENEKVGVVLNRFDDDAMREAINRLLQLTQTDGISERCRDVALRYFSLDEGVRRYSHVYQRVLETL